MKAAKLVALSLIKDQFANLPPSRLAPLAAGVFAALLYGATLMTQVSGCAADYCVDVGEFQVALPLWGTVHHTGYPLYMLLGSPFVAGLRWLGIAPAAGASLFSLVWAVLAVVGLSALVTHLSGRPSIGFAAGWLFAVLEPIWVHASMAEVYSLSLALTVAILWLAVVLRERWSDRGGWLLAFLCGLGVAHHRLIAVLLPAVGLYLLGPAWTNTRFGRWLSVAAACLLAGFLPYLDEPWRVWRGSVWNYGRPDTWPGFWAIFLGTEVAGLQRPLTHGRDLMLATADVVRTLGETLTRPGSAFAVGAAAVAVWPGRDRRPVWLLIAVLVSYLAFAVVFQPAVLVAADLMPALAACIALAGVGVSRLRPPYYWLGTLAVVVLAGRLTLRNYNPVLALTHDPSSTQYVASFDQLEAPPGAVIMAPWGSHFFALAYARLVDGRFRNWTIVDHRADFSKLGREQGRIFTATDTLYVFGKDWWAARLGQPLRITSAGPAMLALTAQPLPTAQQAGVSIGDGIRLVDWDVRSGAHSGQMVVTTYWSAQRTLATDYSTYVYLSDQDNIVSPADLLAQSDSAAPVDGWYPTSEWLPGEVIREDHVLSLPAERQVRTILIGMYTRDQAGIFVQLQRVALDRGPNGTWALRS